VSVSTPSPELIEAEKRAAVFGKVLMNRDDLTAYCRLRDTVSAFAAYHERRDHPDGAGCSNCGGLPHTETCFVGLFLRAAGWDGPRPEPRRPEPEHPLAKAKP
jgi:hypothetical protein